MAERKVFIFLCASLFMGALLLNGEILKAQHSATPNFVFYITDDIGWGDLACYGNPDVKTPNIDRLASKGLKFENVYLTTSSCSPSRNSIISGRYPHNTGAPELHDPLPAGQVMFPQLMSSAGYYTVLSGKNHMGNQIRDAFDVISTGKGNGGQEDWLSIMKERPKEKPFFFWFASHDAHRDWQIDSTGVVYDPAAIKVPPMLFDGPETRKDLASYYHEISRADYYLGELVKELEAQDILDNTYIIFMSDNGSPFPRNKVRLYDSGIKTPFIVSGPAVRRGINKALISSIDIAPTILELAGVQGDNRIQGQSFTQILKANQKKFRDFAFAEHNWHVFQAHERMVRHGDWVYIRNSFAEKRNLAGESTRQFPAGKELWDAWQRGLTNSEQEDIFISPRQSEELFNVKQDPYQFNNVSQSKRNQKLLTYLRGAVDLWIEQTGDSVPVNPTPDRDDINGNRLPGKWEKGDKPGESKQAETITNPGPIIKLDFNPL